MKEKSFDSKTSKKKVEPLEILKFQDCWDVSNQFRSTGMLVTFYGRATFSLIAAKFKPKKQIRFGYASAKNPTLVGTGSCFDFYSEKIAFVSRRANVQETGLGWSRNSGMASKSWTVISVAIVTE